MNSNPLKAKLPERWASSVQAIKAVQVAFDVSEAVLEAVSGNGCEANIGAAGAAGTAAATLATWRAVDSPEPLLPSRVASATTLPATEVAAPTAVLATVLATVAAATACAAFTPMATVATVPATLATVPATPAAVPKAWLGSSGCVPPTACGVRTGG